MSLLVNWLPTLLGAVIFVGFSVAVLALFSALATKIEDRFLAREDVEVEGVSRVAA
ncbi:MAG: hypothetical protein Q7T82_12055 [Armatimonadota bacterium]|nr:hypothetical protein [Armatimonadota bacterium]